MTKRRDHRILEYEGMCRGPNPKMVKHHEDAILYHQMMVKFYALSKKHQRIFMAMFEELCGED